MELTIVNEKENPLFSRKELEVKVTQMVELQKY